MSKKPASQAALHDEHATFTIGQRVMARNFRSDPPWILGTIKERLYVGLLTYLHNGKVWKYHVDHVKALGESLPSQLEEQSSSESEEFTVPEIAPDQASESPATTPSTPGPSDSETPLPC